MQAVKALAEEAKVKDAMKPANPAERNRILALVAKPDYLGCQHLKVCSFPTLHMLER